MRKDQLPVGRRHDPLAVSDLPLLNFLRWSVILGTLIFVSLTIWFFMTAHHGLSVGFLVAAILFGLMWRVATQQLKASTTDQFPPTSKNMKKNIWRAVIEVGFIIFLFYSNLLMGEFERSGMGEKRGLAWAMTDVFTSLNFVIALIAALVGYVLFEFLRKRF